MADIAKTDRRCAAAKTAGGDRLRRLLQATRRSAIDGRTTRHPGYAASQRVRKRIEEGFGWMKAVAGFDRPKLRCVDRVGWAFTFAAAAYNLVRLPKLLATPA